MKKTNLPHLFFFLLIAIFSNCDLEVIPPQVTGGGDSLMAGFELTNNHCYAPCDPGFTESAAGDSDVCLLITDDRGAILWKNNYNKSTMDEGFSLIQTEDKDYLIVGKAVHSNLLKVVHFYLPKSVYCYLPITIQG